MAPHTRELFANLLRREIRGRYKGSWLGVGWTMINPIVAMLAYTLVFTVLFRAFDGIPRYPQFLLVGQAFWLFFSGAIIVAASSLIGNADLVKKVRFPRQIVPIASMTSQALPAGIMTALLVPAALVWNDGDRKTLLLLPFVVLCCVALVAGLALALSVINVYFRDTEHILNALILPWFFITPILFTFSTFPLATSKPWLVDVLKFVNFPTPFVLALQDCLYWGAWPSWKILSYIAVVGFGSLALGWWTFRKLERDIAVEL